MCVLRRRTYVVHFSIRVLKKNVEDRLATLPFPDSHPQHNRISSLLGIEWLLSLPEYNIIENIFKLRLQ